MPSGGHANSGPPRDPNALRRDRDKGDTGLIQHLPAAGREGEPPPFPLDRPADRELKLWAAEWRRPQAVMWEREGMAFEVALYIRAVVTAEKDDASAPERALVFKQMESLGISLAGLRRNGWVIDHDSDDAKQVATTDDPDHRTPAKSRFKTIAGGRSA